MIVKNALVINLNGEIKIAALKAWEELRNKFSIKYISSRSPCPHIAIIYDFEIIKYETFKSRITRFCNNMTSFIVSARGLGVFVAETPVVYLRWRVNKYLTLLKNNLSNFLKSLEKENIIKNYLVDDEWIPKTTLAYRDSNYTVLEAVLMLLMNNDFKGSMNVETILLYEYTPELGEKELEEFKLGGSLQNS